MSDENYFDIKVDEVYQGVVGKVANLSVGLVDSDNKYDLKVMISNSGEVNDHILEVVNQVPELFEENGADGDVSAYTSLSHYLVKESEYQIKKELGLPEYQWTPEELGFNFFNKQTENGIETVVEKDVYIPSLEAEFPIQFAMKDRYEFEVVNTTPDLLSKTYSEDINTIKQEALESFKKNKAEVTMKLIENEYRDRKGVSNDEMYLKHIEIDTMPSISNLEVDKTNNVVKADIVSSFAIVDEYNEKNLKSDFSKDTSVELPITTDSGGHYEIDYNDSKYGDGIKSYMQSFKSYGGLPTEMMDKIVDKKEDNDFMLTIIESEIKEAGIKPEEPKQKKSKGFGISM